MPPCNDALRGGGGDRHLWLTALPDNQIPAHPSPAPLLNLSKSDHEGRAVYHQALFISCRWGNGNPETKSCVPSLGSCQHCALGLSTSTSSNWIQASGLGPGACFFLPIRCGVNLNTGMSNAAPVTLILVGPSPAFP